MYTFVYGFFHLAWRYYIIVLYIYQEIIVFTYWWAFSCLQFGVIMNTSVQPLVVHVLLFLLDK